MVKKEIEYDLFWENAINNSKSLIKKYEHLATPNDNNEINRLINDETTSYNFSQNNKLKSIDDDNPRIIKDATEEYLGRTLIDNNKEHLTEDMVNDLNLFHKKPKYTNDLRKEQRNRDRIRKKNKGENKPINPYGTMEPIIGEFQKRTVSLRQDRKPIFPERTVSLGQSQPTQHITEPDPIPRTPPIPHAQRITEPDPTPRTPPVPHAQHITEPDPTPRTPPIPHAQHITEPDPTPQTPPIPHAQPVKPVLRKKIKPVISNSNSSKANRTYGQLRNPQSTTFSQNMPPQPQDPSVTGIYPSKATNNSSASNSKQLVPQKQTVKDSKQINQKKSR